MNNLTINLFIKNIFFLLMFLIVFLVASEMLLRIAYFQLKGDKSFALAEAFEDANNLYLRVKANKILKNLDLPQNLFEELYSQDGKELLDKFKLMYEAHFALLINKTNEINAKLAVLYIPSSNFSRQTSREFYKQLAEKYSVEFIDVTEEFSKYPENVVTLLPENAHLSRFGNQLITKKLAKYIDQNTNYRANFTFKNKQKIFGDLVPNTNSDWKIVETMPYHVITNSQGLRMSYDIPTIKEKQRILILGDSFTFGPYLDNHDTFPSLLDKKYLDKIIINAGVAGYNIEDELSLFIEKARYTEPDIVILQVLDNDLSDFFFFLRNQFGRQKKLHKPLKLEEEFLNKIKEK